MNIYRYVTEATFDAYLYQTVENKQKFISQIMTSKSPVRACEDVDETALSYAEIKALCAGDDRIKEKMQLDIEVAQLRLLKSEHQSQHFRLEDSLIREFPERIEAARARIIGYEGDMARLDAHPLPKDGFPGMTIHGTSYSEKDKAGAALLDACRQMTSEESLPMGTYRGFEMNLSFDSLNKQFRLTLKGDLSHQIDLGTDVYGNLTRINNVLADMPERLETAKAQLDNLHQQQENARLELQNPFPQERDLAEKFARLAELDAALNMDGGRDEEAENLEEDPAVPTDKPSVLHTLRDRCSRAADADRPERRVETQPAR